MKLFIDTWGWIALCNKKENGYKIVNEFYNDAVKNRQIILTTDYVLCETITYIFKKLYFNIAKEYIEGILRNVENGLFGLEIISSERFKKAWDLRLKFSDKSKISFTDLTSFVVMAELNIKDVLTSDKHFEVINMGFRKVL